MSASNSRMKNLKKIALLLESDMAFDRAIARGVGDFARTNKGWLVLMDPLMSVTPQGVKHWNPDGIITSVEIAKRSGGLDLPDIPVVGVGGSAEGVQNELGLPLVASHHTEIGRTAARHFLIKGFKNFAFCGGVETESWCAQRRVGFQQELEDKGYAVSVYEPDLDGEISMPAAIVSLGKWLVGLPKPTGVFVYFDGWARWVLDACVMREIKVPQEVAVLGVDNDRWLCELAQPSLSSVDPNVPAAGFRAAKILDDLLKGAPAPPPTTIAPLGVEERESTNLMAFDSSEVAFAMRYIREHACDPITPADVLAVTGMSNSTAYRKFMKEIGHSVHAEIQQVQMERVKELLTTTNLSVTEVGQQAGFDNVRYLTKVFRDTVGCTPKQYRRTQGTASL